MLVTEGAEQVSSAVIHAHGLLPPVCFCRGPSLRCSAAIVIGEKTRLPEKATAPSFAAGRLVEERERLIFCGCPPQVASSNQLFAVSKRHLGLIRILHRDHRRATS
jgi:hypothetical protein